ncbi:urease accessory protein [Motilibacter rhizosphaerae]|uniref:Urease accessory protein UreD n=1 Tax=Motilibacter rhizosphaerae TaxID=598652 RepID=A0A4Q7NWT2_9ACTN|nr:urease accessory protein UreD [Motilibacter rhizosphaerae]RZS91695.1 urease accessory protein [Motilibacter rhizosphaerae]
MRASATLVAELVHGETRVTTLACEPPLVARTTGPGRIHLVAAAGGPCRGDDLTLHVRVGPGASLEVCSTGATVALRGRVDDASVWRTSIEVAEGATLVWTPEPTVAAAGCRHVADTRVRLAADASLVLREELVTGRTGEDPGGDLTAALRVERAGVAVYDQEMAVGPAAPVLGAYRAVGALVAVGQPAPPAARLLGGLGFVAPLAAPDAWAATAVAPDAAALRRLLSLGVPRQRDVRRGVGPDVPLHELPGQPREAREHC